MCLSPLCSWWSLLVFISPFDFQVKLQNEINLRRKAETSAAVAEEKASVLEGKLSHLSESIEREKRHLNNDLAHLKRESKLSVARITADVSTDNFKLSMVVCLQASTVLNFPILLFSA